MSAPAILPCGPKWTRMNLPCKMERVRITWLKLDKYDETVLQNVRSCHFWWFWRFQMPQGQDWPGSPDLQDWLSSVWGWVTGLREREREREREKVVSCAGLSPLTPISNLSTYALPLANTPFNSVIWKGVSRTSCSNNTFYDKPDFLVLVCTRAWNPPTLHYILLAC